MTRVQVTYIAMQADNGRIPIVSASTFENLEKGLDYYYGVDAGYAIKKGFTIYNTKYPDAYEGYFIYECSDGSIDEVRVYCIDYYPHTVYEINE